ncbi:MAG: restriction endonuclease subunit S, partial [Anaerolineales bacterium]|nr:restriction endonuclease subunit S [Anaerolineales bacterium]
MKQVPLSEVAEFINGRAFKPEDWQTEGLPIIRIQNLTGSTDTVNYYSGKVEPRYLVRNDDILISWSASLGVYKWQGGDAILNQHIFKVELKEKLIDKEYFYYAAQNALVEMESHVHGATMQHITRDPFLAIEIPLPPLTEQKRIASLLARADRLRQLRRTAHDLGDALLQSVFLEMFGDVATNSKKWEKIELGDALDVITYGLTVRPEYIEKGIPLISARE